MNWQDFLSFYETFKKSPVVLPILKTTRLIDDREHECLVACDNGGVKFYLDGKKTEVDEVLQEYTKSKKTVVFTVLPSPKKKSAKSIKKDEPLPLAQFQDNKNDKIRSSGLQPHFTFDNFAVSNTNTFAHAAAQAVTENLGHIYNPFFVYGDVGVGKTHLSHAIANKILDHNMKKKVLYCTSEQFTNDLVEFIREKNTKEFRKKYRNLDILIVDDVQFIAGKNYVQEEFYHTFNSIVQRGGQIILTSDRPPREIKELEDRLRSRFAGGLIIDMQKPDFALRTAILLIKAKERKIDIDMDAAKHIAENVMDSRELEGALLKLLSIKLMQNSQGSISFDETATEMKKEDNKIKEKLNAHDIIKTVSLYYNVKPTEIKGPSRKESFVLARQVCMLLLRNLLGITFDEVAFILKKKDHTTVIHGVDKIEHRILHDMLFKEEVDKISSSIMSPT